MLVLSRRIGDCIQIGPDVRIMVTAIERDGRVRLGITAPRAVDIVRCDKDGRPDVVNAKRKSL